MSRMQHIQHAAVVVPVHDEAESLDTCMAALVEAAENAQVPTTIVVVLDSCTDASTDIAAVWSDKTGATIVGLDRRNVGAARAAGFLAAPQDVDTWFATTDADSVVRPDWLSRQLAHAERGARVVAGTVTPDLGTASPLLTVAYDAGYRNRTGHRHVHGANLGMRADDYWSVGGFGALVTGEDVDLIRRFEHAAVPVLYACDAPVRTSARRVGRAPDGFASHLQTLELAVAQ